MSSNIEIQRICEYCNQKFKARTTVTKYCSHKCNSRAYKERTRKKKIEKSNTLTEKKLKQPIEQLKAKEFLTVREVSQLLNCSVRSVYYYIEDGTISAVNLGQRLTRIKRSEIDKIFNTKPKKVIKETDPIQISINDCYTISEVIQKFNISSGALYNLIKRNGIPKTSKGKFVFVPKTEIENLLT